MPGEGFHVDTVKDLERPRRFCRSRTKAVPGFGLFTLVVEPYVKLLVVAKSDTSN
jgi:hypothetical protein